MLKMAFTFNTADNTNDTIFPDTQHGLTSMPSSSPSDRKKCGIKASKRLLNKFKKIKNSV